MFEFVILILLAGLVISTLAGLVEALAGALHNRLFIGRDRRDWRDLNRR